MKIRSSVSLLALVCLEVTRAQAPAGSGAVSGMVRDNYGDGMPDATVVLSNPALQVRRTFVTTDDGAFADPTVTPSPGYRIKVTRKGFGDFETTDFEVGVGQTLNFKIDLQPEAPAVKVAAPQAMSSVQDTKIGIGTWITPAQVDTLPASERRVDSLVLLAPAVTSNPASGQLAFAGIASSNSFVTDGIVTTNTFTGARPGLANQLSDDAVQELQVISANAPAEFGQAMGGFVNATTRSGSGSFHGTAYEYFSNNALSAGSRYALGQNLLQKLNQAGGSVGGPIGQTRLFFFTNFEVLDGHANGLNRITSPLIADAAGNQVSAANCTATAAQCAAAARFIQAQMNVAVPLTERQVTGLARIDYRRSDRNSFNIEFNALNGNSPEGGPLEHVAANGGLLGLKNTQEYTRYGRLGWTSAPSPNTVNELRAGLFQDRLFDPASQSVPGLGNVGVSIAGVTVGAANPNSGLFSERRYQFLDNFTVTSNTHTVKLGGDLWHTRDRIDSLNSAGFFTYPSLTAFAQDFSNAGTRGYTSFAQQFGTDARELPARQVNLYAQDTWRPLRRLTVVAGVRFEKPSPPQPSQVNSTYYQTGTIASPNIDFAPRVGISYLLNDKTVVRFGFSFYYAPLPGTMLDALYLGNGVGLTSISVNPNQAGAPFFPNGIASAAGIPAGTRDLIYGSSKLRNPRNQESSFAVERSLRRDTTLTLSVINGRVIKLWTGTDTNLVAAAKTATYPIDNAAGQAVGSYTTQIWSGKVDPAYAHIYEIDNTGSSWYDAAVVEIRKRMSHGMALEGSFTWSHAISDVGGPLWGGFLPLSTEPSNYAGDKGNTPTDQRRRGAIRWVWQPTFTRNTSPLARFLVNGWELSGITTLASGSPQTALVVVRGQQFSTVTMAYTDSLNGSGGWARVPFLPVSGLYTDPQYAVNLRLTRTLPLTERVKGMLTFEAFNLFNSQSATAVDTVAYQAVAAPPAGTVSGPMNGVLKPVAGLGTGIASQAFPDGTSARRCQVSFRVVF